MTQIKKLGQVVFLASDPQASADWYECHMPMEKGKFDYEHRLGAGGLIIPV